MKKIMIVLSAGLIAFASLACCNCGCDKEKSVCKVDGCSCVCHTDATCKVEGCACVCHKAISTCKCGCCCNSCCKPRYHVCKKNRFCGFELTFGGCDPEPMYQVTETITRYETVPAPQREQPQQPSQSQQNPQQQQAQPQAQQPTAQPAQQQPVHIRYVWVPGKYVPAMLQNGQVIDTWIEGHYEPAMLLGQ